jgi:hypothetical protein
VVRTETAVALIVAVFVFLCFPGEVEASDDHAMLQAAACCPRFRPVEMCSAEVALGHIVLPVVSYPPVSIIVPMFHARRHHTDAAVRLETFQKWRRQTFGRKLLPHLQALEGTRVQALAQYLVPCGCHSPSM